MKMRGEPTRAGGVDLAADRAVLVGEERDHRRDELRCHLRSSLGGRRRPAMRVNAAGAMTLTLMPCAAPAVVRLRVSPMTPPLAVA